MSSDGFDALFGAGTEQAHRCRSIYQAHGRSDEVDLYLAISDVLNGTTAVHYLPSAAGKKTWPDEEVYPRTEVQDFIEAWAEAGFDRDIPLILSRGVTDQPAAPVIEAIPLVARLREKGYSATTVSSAWTEGYFLTLYAIAHGIEPELAGALT